MPAGNALNQGGQALPLPATWKLLAFEIRAARGSGCLARIFHTLSAAAGCKPDWRRWPRVPHRTVCPHTARFGIASAALPSGLSLRLATKGCETSGLGADSIPSRVLPPAILPGEGGCLAGPSRSSEGQADGLSPLSGPRLRPRKCRVTFEVDSHSRVVS